MDTLTLRNGHSSASHGSVNDPYVSGTRSCHVYFEPTAMIIGHIISAMALDTLLRRTYRGHQRYECATKKHGVVA